MVAFIASNALRWDPQQLILRHPPRGQVLAERTKKTQICHVLRIFWKEAILIKLKSIVRYKKVLRYWFILQSA